MVAGAGAAPAAAVARTGTIRVVNRGALPAYLSSHFPLVRASRALDFPREGLEGARLRLPAGAMALIEPGEEVELEIMWS